MFYRFSSVTGRLINATQAEAFMPQGLRKIIAQEMPISSSVKFTPATEKVEKIEPAPIRSSSSVASSKYGPVPEHIKLAQEKFQKPDGVPVHLKGGPTDHVLYYITIGLSVVGTVLFVNLIYDLGFPKKNKD